MARPMRVCLVNDSSVNPNWGCRATTWALKDLIVGAGCEISATVTLDQLLSLSLRDRRSWDRTLKLLDPFVPRRPFVREVLRRGVDKVRHRLPDVAPTSVDQLESLSAALVRGEILGYAKHAFESCDAVIVNGEGGIYGFKREARLMLFLAYVAKVHFGLSVALVNHTAELSDQRLQALAAKVYPLLDDVVFREPVSARKSIGLVTGHVAPDAAFRFEPAPLTPWREVASRPDYYSVWPDSARFDPTEPFVAVGGSALFGVVGRTTQLLEGMAGLVLALQARVAPVVLTASDLPDEAVLRTLARELDLPLIGLHVPVQQAVDLLGNARAYVGGRWHPSIFAVLGGAPFVPLATHSHKLEGLAEMFGLPAPSVDLFEMSTRIDEVVDLVKEHVMAGDSLRHSLRAKAETLRPSAKRHIAILGQQSSARVRAADGPGNVPTGPARTRDTVDFAVRVGDDKGR